MRRQISENEKAQLILKYRNQDDGFIHCFVDNEIIENEKDIHFDHIEPFAKTKKTELSNIAPICRKHNLAKKDMTLSEYRDKLQMQVFFEQFDLEGKQTKLNDVLLLKYQKEFGFPIQYSYDSQQNKITVKYYKDKKKIHLPQIKVYDSQQCPITKMNYFYAQIPTKNILNDGKEEAEIELQPRPLIQNHLWSLYRHLRVNTQLQPSICRVDNNDGNNVLVFDGQHKAAAQIWAGAHFIDAKIYIEPNVLLLMRTNLIAHDKLKQLRFYSSILAEKMAQLYGVNWEKYFESKGVKSEKGFCDFIKYSEDKLDEKPIKQIEAFLVTSILDDEENNFKKYVSPVNKTGKQYVISWDAMRKYYFRYFLNRPPLTFEFDSKEDNRNHEIHNNIRLLNILEKEILSGKWNPTEANEEHKKTERIFRIGAIMAWFPILRDVIFFKIDLVNTEDSKSILFRVISEEKWKLIEHYVNKMFNHQIWVDKDANIDIVFGNKKLESTKALFLQKGFTTEWILGFKNT
ncbi:HNH endonuclease [Thermoproteota archaeon]